jgi:hypothetical protein
MREIIIAGLALSAVLAALPPAGAMGGEAQWCRLERDGARGGECIFYTFAQCAASTERLNGGGCYENPNYRGGATPAAVRGVRRHKPRHAATR